MHGAQNTCLNACHTLSKKMHLHPCMRAYATVQKLLCHGKYCEIILSPVRASLKPSSAARSAAGPTKSAARGCPRKKSSQIHVSSRLGRRRSVAQASFNHPRWCRPHSVCLWSHLQLGREGHPFKKSISAIFSRELLRYRKLAGKKGGNRFLEGMTFAAELQVRP